MAYKLLDMAQARWRRLDGAHLLPLVRGRRLRGRGPPSEQGPPGERACCLNPLSASVREGRPRVRVDEGSCHRVASLIATRDSAHFAADAKLRRGCFRDGFGQRAMAAISQTASSG
jgi:hypothetical protein